MFDSYADIQRGPATGMCIFTGRYFLLILYFISIGYYVYLATQHFSSDWRSIAGNGIFIVSMLITLDSIFAASILILSLIGVSASSQKTIFFVYCGGASLYIIFSFLLLMYTTEAMFYRSVLNFEDYCNTTINPDVNSSLCETYSTYWSKLKYSRDRIGDPYSVIAGLAAPTFIANAVFFLCCIIQPSMFGPSPEFLVPQQNRSSPKNDEDNLIVPDGQRETMDNRDNLIVKDNTKDNNEDVDIQNTDNKHNDENHHLDINPNNIDDVKIKDNINDNRQDNVELVTITVTDGVSSQNKHTTDVENSFNEN